MSRVDRVDVSPARKGQPEMRIGRTIAILGVSALLLALSLFTPVGAHVGGTVGHLWTQHLLPLAKRVFYTKTLANDRFLSPNETTRKFVWRVANDADTTLIPIFSRWDLEISASCVLGDVHAEVDAVSDNGSLVGGFIDNFGDSHLLRNTDFDPGSIPVDLNDGSNFTEAGGYFTYTSVAGSVVTVQYEMSNSANADGTECLVSGIAHRVP